MNYIKNKGFIPIKYYNKIKIKKDKSTKRAISYLILLNIIAAPLSLEKIFKTEDLKIDNNIVNYEKEISKDNIIQWVNQVDEDVFFLNVYNGNGEIEVTNKKKIYSIEKEYGDAITNIKNGENDKITVFISKED